MMNEQANNRANHEEKNADAFVDSFIQNLEDESKLDYQTQYQLAKARESALNHHSSSHSYLSDILVLVRKPVVAMGLLVPLIAVFWFLLGSPSINDSQQVVEDIEILSMDTDYEMLEDLEFYSWLAEDDNVSQ